MNSRTPDAVRRLRRDVVAGEARPLSLAIAAGVLRQSGFLALPFALQRAVDDGLVAGSADATTRWAAIVAGLGVVTYLGLCGWVYCSNIADTGAGRRLRTALVARMLDGTVPDTRVGGAGDLVLRAGRDVALVRRWVHGLPTWAVIATTVVVLVPGLWSLHPLLLAVAAGTVPLLVAIALLFPRALEPRTDALARAHARRADDVDFIVRAAPALRGIGATDTAGARHHAASHDLTARAVAVSDLEARWMSLGDGVPAVAVGVGVLVGGLAALDGHLTAGGLIAFTTWMGTVGVAVEVGLTRIAQAVEAGVGLRRLSDVLGPDGMTPPRHDTPSRAADAGRLVVTDAATHAPAAPVSFETGRGRLLALTGGVGVGKSTLLRALAGQAPLRGGEISFGDPGHAGAVRAHLVPQRPLMLAGSVRDNLTLGDDVAAGVLRQALFDVGLDEELADLEAHVADGSLSGGQVQRLALARALVDDAPVLLLDDVTSAVDADTSRRILAALRREADRRIVVLSTHRVDLLAAADEVVQLEASS